MTDPEKTIIKANRVVCDVKITFDKGDSLFEQKFNLKGVSNFFGHEVIVLRLYFAADYRP